MSTKLVWSILIFLSTGLMAQPQWQDPSSQMSDKAKADTLYSIAMKHFYRSAFDSAIFYLVKGLPFAEQTQNDEFIIKYRFSVGNSFILNNEADKGLAYVRSATPALQKLNNYELNLKFLTLSSMAHEKMFHLDSAIIFLHQCEELNNKENPYNNWSIYSQLGFMLQKSESYVEAEKYFLKGYNLVKTKSSNRIDYGIILYRLGNLYYQIGETTKFANILAEQQLFVQSAKQDYSRFPDHKMYFADWKKEPFDKKVSFMEGVKKQYLASGSIQNVANTNLYLAEFYEEKNQNEKALSYLWENDRQLSMAKEINNLYINTKSLYRLLKKNGNEKEAIVIADKLFLLKDSILRIQHREKLMELETKYETERKEKDLAILNSENQLNTLRLEKQKVLFAKERDIKDVLARENTLKDSVVKREKEFNRLLSGDNELKVTQLSNELELKASLSRENALKGEQLKKEKRTSNLLIFGSAVIVLSSILIFALYRNQRTKNQIIQRQSDELQTLMKEIHHRVKNNLQVISSLLDLQALSIKDKQAADAVREGKIRVQSMALIHQNLYNEGNIKGILMEDYIKNLVENLFQSYNIQKDKIQLVTDIGHLNLDIDTVIPLGLILNELISNSLKYAFKEKEQGVIKVILKEQDHVLELKVKDNGAGFPPNWNRIKSNSFGFNLINAFAQKLKAKMEVYNDNGACVSMNISRYKLA